MTASSQPSIEDLVLGGIPGIPKVHFHNPFLAYENGEDFIKIFHDAATDRIDPFILVIEGSYPKREKQSGRLLGFVRYRQEDRPTDHDV
jgi:hydrogenase small subunit